MTKPKMTLGESILVAEYVIQYLYTGGDLDIELPMDEAMLNLFNCIGEQTDTTVMVDPIGPVHKMYAFDKEGNHKGCSWEEHLKDMSEGWYAKIRYWRNYDNEADNNVI